MSFTRYPAECSVTKDGRAMRLQREDTSARLASQEPDTGTRRCECLTCEKVVNI